MRDVQAGQVLLAAALAALAATGVVTASPTWTRQRLVRVRGNPPGLRRPQPGVSPGRPPGPDRPGVRQCTSDNGGSGPGSSG
ncbi:hypothetical protein [Nocardia sp. NPDC052112]|uniref:hypothetical protein n=1 Tax=Nocardia sp. NPDC052112 TaxID=3155646 RepID=UPI003444A649